MRLTHRLWFGLFPLMLLVAAGSAVIAARSDHESSPISLAIAFPMIGLSFVVSGLIAWTLRPTNGTGRLLVLVGFTIVVGVWLGPLYTVAAALLGAYFLFLAHRLRADASKRNAVLLFHYSLAYLALLFVAAAIDPLVV